MYIEATGRGPYESARLTLLPGGRFELAVGSANSGQGHETVFSQIAADGLGIAPEDITMITGDTAAGAQGFGTFASRTAVVTGNAVKIAADRMTARAEQLCALLPGEPSWAELAAALEPRGTLADHGKLEVVGRFEPDTVTWTAGAHATIVGLDPETGLASVLRYAVAHEGGIDINPLVVEGQVIGGVAQGIGGTLLEEFTYDNGQPTTGTFADYLLPSSVEVPPVAVRHLEAPADNPLGARGAGESGTIAVYAAVASALDAALGERAPRVAATPVHPAWLADAAAHHAQVAA
jgi:carbon-monoxide dehydrogenase large subunit